MSAAAFGSQRHQVSLELKLQAVLSHSAIGDGT